MIDPKLLTPENGFAVGEDVKIMHRHSDGDFFVAGNVMRINSRGIVLDMPITARNGVTVCFSDIISIRPLTGPMAIWNFAPKWADGFIETPNQALHEWITRDSEWFYNADCVKRPFWAKE